MSPVVSSEAIMFGWRRGALRPYDEFGEEIAAGYADNPRGDETQTVECLRQLAGDGPVLELAIGTGG